MKCLWYCSLALVMGVAMISTSSAQSDWGNPSEIGSYQSILSSYGQPVQQGQQAVQHANNAVQQAGQAMQQAAGQAGHAGHAVQSVQPMQGNGVHYAPVQTGNCGPTYSAPMGGQVMGGQVMGGQVVGSAPAMGGQVMGGQVMGGGAAYSPIYGADYSYGAGGGAACGGAVYGTPAYSAAAYAPAAPAFSGGYGLVQAAAPARNVNRIAGVRGLFFQRDYEDDRRLSFNGTNDLFSTDADHGTIGGIEAFMGARNANGRGWEARYWGLYAQQADVTLVGAPYATTSLTGLTNISHVSGFDAYSIYNFGDSHRLYRDTDIHSLEFNLLRNVGCFQNRRGRNVSYELLGGFRWFQFDESLRYSSFSTTAGYPAELHYNLDVQNTLLGLQFGGRSETCLTQRLRLLAGTRVGIFNNNIRSSQSIVDENGVYGYINNGASNNVNYDFRGEKNDVAFLGELDLGLAYQMSCRSRLTFGYRALGISGVALAADQIPHDFANQREIERINSNGSLLLHGGYAGLEWCY